MGRYTYIYYIYIGTIGSQVGYLMAWEARTPFKLEILPGDLQPTRHLAPEASTEDHKSQDTIL